MKKRFLRIVYNTFKVLYHVAYALIVIVASPIILIFVMLHALVNKIIK